jgi:hypothetical protein
MISLGVAVEREEMVPVPDGIDAHFFDAPYRVREILVACLLRMKLCANSYWVRLLLCHKGNFLFSEKEWCRLSFVRCLIIDMSRSFPQTAHPTQRVNRTELVLVWT